ncbi:MAG: DUF2927 domain-containing protein [Methanoregula sp.]|jgi:hypothetical protein|uniref:DUF2927 domain-containing protein n=1 Tax=Methanoregula sp. TaxID=2052170 RepID=UPI003C25870A
MKHKYSVLLLSILLVGVFFMAGCTSSTSEPVSTPVATPTPQVVYVTVTVTPTAANSTATQITPITNSTESSIYNSSEIDKHFIDIAFNSKSRSINNKFQTIGGLSASGDTVAITGSYTDNDVSTLSNFLLQFNNNSPIMQLPTVPVRGSNGSDINFIFMRGSSMDTLAQVQPSVGLINRDNSGKVCSIYKTISNIRSNSTNGYYTYRTGTIFVNNDLTGDERTHYMISGLLYYLGFVGQTTTYPDSIFYAGQNNTTTPNLIDWQAIDLMYSGKITPGMTIVDVRQVLYGTSENTGT